LVYLFVNKKNKIKNMKRIVRLTESDLARIVRKVINENRYLNEAVRNIGKTFNVDGDTFQATIGANDRIFYWGTNSQSKAMGATVDKLNKLSGYNIPAANGELTIGYIQKNPGFKTTLRGLIA
jgi:hypothetical protein